MTVFRIIIATCLLSVIAWSDAPAPLQLEACLADAAQRHPVLKQHYEAWRAALERIPQAQGLEDPQFSYGQFILSDTQRAKVSIRQQLPWFGMRKAQGDVAAAEADRALSEMHAARDALFFEVKQSFFAYAQLAEQTRIVASQEEVLVYMEEIVQAKLALGLGYDDELLRIGIARTELIDRVQQLEAMRPVFSHELSTAMGRSLHEVLPWPEAVALPTASPQLSEVVLQIKEGNPGLHALEHKLHGLHHRETVAEKQGRPDVTLGLDWTSISKPRQLRPDRPYPASLNAASRMVSTAMGNTPLLPRNVLIDSYSLLNSDEPMRYSKGGEDNLMVSVSMRVPLWRKKVRAGIQEVRHLQSAAQHEHHAQYLTLENQAQRILFHMDDTARRYTLYTEQLIPQVQLTSESLQEQYAMDIGVGAFVDILATLQQQLEFQWEQNDVLHRWHQYKAELDLLTGEAVVDEQ